MNSIIRGINRRTGYIAAAFAVILSTIVPALAFADQVTERSIELSSSSVNATNVTYNVSFKSVSGAGAFVVDFCENTPLLGEACTSPATTHGFSAASVASTTSGFTDVSDLDDNTVRVTGTIAADTVITVALTGITNPNVAETLYARIVTYDTPTNANLYTSTGAAEGAGGVVDNGGVALSITPTVGVSGAVLESMTFCVAGDVNPATPANPITSGSCNGGAALPAPTVKLGAVVGDTTVLDAQNVYEGKVYTQISTNAASGAVINLKSNTTGCGGLARAGAANFAAGCGILPATDTSNITAGQAKFGVKTGTAAGVDTPSGTLQPVGAGSGFYGDSIFRMNWVSGDASGVTSPYGDPFLDTDGAPVNNMGMPITFGASISNNTPAGRYSADLSLIATGKF